MPKKEKLMRWSNQEILELLEKKYSIKIVGSLEFSAMEVIAKIE